MIEKTRIPQVRERAALPQYDTHEGDRASLERLLPGCLGWLWRILSWLRGQSPPGPAEVPVVVTPPGPEVYKYATFFRKNAESIAASRRAFGDYRSKYQEGLAAESYPLRVQKGHHTGLIAGCNGLLDAPASIQTPDDAVRIGSGWLFQDLPSRVLFGLAPSDAERTLRVAAVHVIERRRGMVDPSAASQQESGGKVTTGSENKQIVESPGSISTPPVAHVVFQQWHGEWPVLGGHVAVHLPTDERRVSATSSYFPLRADAAFAPKIDKARAIATARLVLANYLELDLAEWSASIVPYAGSGLFILPFAGQYYLAHQIEFVSSAADQAYRVFVDAESGDALGRPDDLVAYQVSYFATSEGARTNTLFADPALALPTLSAALQPFMRVIRSNGSAVNIAALAAANPPQIDLEATNVAVHASKLVDHFTGVCGVDATRLQSYPRDGGVQQPGLEIVVGAGGSSLTMCFNRAQVQHPKRVTFQTDPGQGLTGEDQGNRVIQSPSLDPEVVYHEIAHGLMWLMNSKPFDFQHESVPFGRALIEGYATYIARSLAARVDAGSTLWARGAYRPAAWGTMWDLSRLDRQPGEDVLPAPNLYPHDQIVGLPVYQVGMIWARALWEMRNRLGAELADRLAVKAFDHVLGWVSNFETAAEGFIDEARLSGVVNQNQIDAIIDIFAGRGILAERGIQSLAQATTAQGGRALLVGTDSGVRQSLDDGNTWQDRGQLAGGAKLSDIVALAASGSTIYAATEDGIYKRNTADPVWSPLGEWPVDQLPVSLAVSDAASDKVYVGTSNGVWHYVSADNVWQSWNSQNLKFEGIALRLAVSDMLSGQTQARIWLVASLTQRLAWAEETAEPRWRNLGRIQSDATKITAVAARGNGIYVGTLAHGVWHRAVAPSGNPGDVSLSGGQWVKISGDNLGSRAVLCLATDATRLYVGTTSGLFTMDLGTRQWAQEDGQLQDKTVISLLATPQHLLVGTAAHAVWRGMAGQAQWTPVLAA